MSLELPAHTQPCAFFDVLTYFSRLQFRASKGIIVHDEGAADSPGDEKKAEVAPEQIEVKEHSGGSRLSTTGACPMGGLHRVCPLRYLLSAKLLICSRIMCTAPHWARCLPFFFPCWDSSAASRCTGRSARNADRCSSASARAASTRAYHPARRASAAAAWRARPGWNRRPL